VAPCAIFFAAFQGWPAIVFFWFEQATMKAGWWAFKYRPAKSSSANTRLIEESRIQAKN